MTTIIVRGRKIAGAAGAENGDTVVIGGTLLFAFDRTRMVRCLKTPRPCSALGCAACSVGA